MTVLRVFLDLLLAVVCLAGVLGIFAWIASLDRIIATSNGRLARSIRKVQDDHARLRADDEIRAAQRAVVKEAERIIQDHDRA